MKRLQALRVVYVVGAASTTLAAPTSLQPPSEALSGLEEPSNAVSHQFQADGFPATAGLDVHEPQATTIVVDESVRTDPDDLFHKLKTWNIRDDASHAAAHDHDQSAVTLADISYNPVDSKPSAAGLDVREPQATTIVVDSVRTQDPDDFFDETRSFRDDAGAHDHDQSAVTLTDVLYNHVDSKLRRRAGSGTQSTSGSQTSSSQELVDISYMRYVENKQAAENLYAGLALIEPSGWGPRKTRKVAVVVSYGQKAIDWLKEAHERGTQARVKGQSGYKLIPLPNLAKETERLNGLISKAQSLPITGATSEAPTSPPVAQAGGPARNRGGYERQKVGSDNGDAESESDDYVPSKPRGYKRKKPVDDNDRDSADSAWLPYKSGTRARTTTSRRKAGRRRKGKQVTESDDPDGDYVPPAGFSSRVGASQTGSSRGGPSTKSSTLAQKAADSDSDYVPGSDRSDSELYM
ncbi:hypothetical protein C8R42DRAFT_722913 [Lentinula raphanica]|nr:hypothetical protein C8R42DRAFT_722913 [Lentinula raphanica]